MPQGGTHRREPRPPGPGGIQMGAAGRRRIWAKKS
uniref:Uncharacterized protein n=1 Tax=Siphoviridae sp. ctKNZ79 TaxID=2825440 RepID=A0A8S5U9L6_9CAUD|nr:MAG TPA: hypothetical protein [Siphoviridae sp. ctKNZ79]